MSRIRVYFDYVVSYGYTCRRVNIGILYTYIQDEVIRLKGFRLKTSNLYTAILGIRRVLRRRRRVHAVAVAYN
jgi:hypothetical protein